MARMISIEFDEHQWAEIAHALYAHAGEIAASEARRTAGKGWASGGKLHAVQGIHEIRDQVNAKLDEEKRKPEVIR